MIYWITVNYYSTALIERLINSIPVRSEIDYRVIIVNNSPDDGSINRLKSGLILIIDSPENIGFGRACNLGLNWVYQQNPQGIVWLINPDARLTEGGLKSAAEFFNRYPELSILGTVVEDPAGKIEFCGGKYNQKTGEIIAENAIGQSPQTPPYTLTKWASGCSLLINLKRFSECPQFDPDYFLYYEDFDFCMRYAKRGHSVAVTSQIRVIHQSSSITNQNQPLKIRESIYSYLLSLEKHGNFWVLGYRLFKISLVSLLSLPVSPQVSPHKLRGVWLYLRRFHPIKLINYSASRKAGGNRQ